MFGLTILLFYSYYFVQILKGQPDRFEQMLLKGFVSDGGRLEVDFTPPWLVIMIVGAALLLEAGYFVLAMTAIDIPAYRVLTGIFILFEVWHGIKAVPVIRVLLHPEEFSEDLFDWKLERMSARLYVVHILITLGLLAAG